MDRVQERLDEICGEFGLLAVYLFGSRADDGLSVLKGRTVLGEGSGRARTWTSAWCSGAGRFRSSCDEPRSSSPSSDAWRRKSSG
jgi:hypothetical protein